MVATNSLREAATLTNILYSQFKKKGFGRSTKKHDIDAAMLKPGKVFERPANSMAAEGYVEVDPYADY